MSMHTHSLTHSLTHKCTLSHSTDTARVCVKMKMSKMKTRFYSITLMMMMMMMMMETAISEAPTSPSIEEKVDMWTTDAPPNLNGKMITLSSDGGGREAGVSFYPPNYSFRQNDNAWLDRMRAYPTRAYRSRVDPTWAYRSRVYPTRASRSRVDPTWAYRSRVYPTRASRSRVDPTWAYRSRVYPTWAYRPWISPTRAYPIRIQPTTVNSPWSDPKWPDTTTAYPYPSWTTASPTVGLTVCLRYLLDGETSGRNIFTLGPSSRAPLTLGLDYDGSYLLAWSSRYWSVRLKANVRLWPGLKDDLWTRLCLTMDTVRGVVQVFNGANMSVRKMAPSKYVWSGEPVIAMSGVDGQVTDLQVWDYPLSYNAILNYMTPPSYGWPRGSVLTWSNIRYTQTGNTLLEDAYELRQVAKNPKKEKKTRKNKKEERKTRNKSFEFNP
ncbi:uncharacterized protein LOC144023671 [Festucalex cinctus]